MSKIKLENLRLAFPCLFQPSTHNVAEGKKGKFQATFLIKKDDPQVKIVHDAIDKLLSNVFPNGAPRDLKIPSFIDGNTKDCQKYQAYQGHMALKASNRIQPRIVDTIPAPLLENDPKAPYAGCYVNAHVGFWYSNHPSGGKQILANLYGVQFLADGESIESNSVSRVDEFDSIISKDDSDSNNYGF